MLFYNESAGLDIDGSWIDMNEPSSVGFLTGDFKFGLTPIQLVLQLSMRRSVPAGARAGHAAAPGHFTARS